MHIEEAARAALQFAFETLGWMEVVSLIRRDNERSIALALRLGEQFERMVDVRGVSLCVYRLGRPVAHAVSPEHSRA